MSSQRHWVEELFPPHFTVSESELTKKPQQADKGTLEAWRISQREKVRDIYEEVKARMDADAQIPKHKSIQAGEPMRDRSRPVKLEGDVKRVESSRGSGVKGETDKENVPNEALWSAGEIAILRKEFQKVKEEKQIIRIELETLRNEFDKLNEKCRRQNKALTGRESELKHLRQEKKRSSLQIEHLNKEVRLQQSKLAMAEDDYREVVEQRLALRKNLIDMRKEYSKAKHDIKELKIALTESDTKHRLESLGKEEALKLDYESQIARLYQELTETREELEKEQREHSRSKKALDHLRIHFAHQAGKMEQTTETASSERRTLKVLQLY